MRGTPYETGTDPGDETTTKPQPKLIEQFLATQSVLTKLQSELTFKGGYLHVDKNGDLRDSNGDLVCHRGSIGDLIKWLETLV